MTKLRILERPQVNRDLEEIISYIAAENTDAAWRFFLAYDRAVELLASNPLIGTERQMNSLALTGTRMLILTEFPRYNIYYVIQMGAIEVIRVIHSARNVEDLF